MTLHEDQAQPAYVMAYVTAPNAEQALKWGKVLVEEKLAGCVNILPSMVSLYLWEGELESSQEAVLLAKTTERQKAALRERIVSLHSYQIPCIVFFPITGGHPPYLDWLSQGIKN